MTNCKGITAKNKNCKQKVNNLIGYCRFHTNQYDEDADGNDDVDGNDEKKEDEKKELIIKQNELILLKNDIKLNSFSWDKLLKQMTKDKNDNNILISKYYSQRNSLTKSSSHLKSAKTNTLIAIQLDPVRFSNLLNIIDIFDIDIQTIEIEKKELYLNLDKLQKININITKFSNNYLSRIKNNSDSKNNFRIKTTDKYECAICYEEDTKGLVLNCGHKFHIDCINKWFHDKLNCPMCKKNLFD